MYQNTQQVLDAIFHDPAIQWAFKQQISFAPPDNQIMTDLDNTSLTLAQKTAKMKKWLGRYKVWRGIACADDISEEIVTFAQTKITISNAMSDAVIIDEFKRLNSMLHVRLNAKKHKERSLLSLTSKALWAVYPDFIPIYDTFLFRAVGMLTKIDDLSSEPITKGLSKHDSDVEKYTKYVNGYMALYRMTAKSIQGFRKRHTQIYPYDIRVFDKVLWAYGKPQYSFPQ